MSQTVAPAFFVGCIGPNFSGAPAQAQINMGPAAVFYDMAANPRIYYTVSADLVSWTAIGSGGSGIPLTQKGAALGVATLDSGIKVPKAQVAGVMAILDLTDGASSQRLPLTWDGTTPALASGTDPVAAGFGSNTFVYTGAGASPTLDGNTGVNGDMFVFTAGAWTKIILGGGYLGDAASTGALQTAYPAASYPCCTARIAGVIYISDGTAWAALNALSTANAAALALQGKAIGVSGPLTLSAALHNGAVLLCTGTPALTINTGLGANFGCAIKGAFTTAGTAAIGDPRNVTGAAYCCLESSDATGAGLSYDLVGTK